MSTWSRNNRAHTQTWFALRVLQQKTRTFDKSEQVTMASLAFWNPTASEQARATAAKTLAIQLDNMFRMMFHATYESGVTKTQAINGMVRILTDGERTMGELAAVNDANYAFQGEPGNA